MERVKKLFSDEISSLVARLRRDYPELVFVRGQRFLFKPPRKIVVTNGNALLLLHEVGHALIGRFEFRTEVERLRIEVAAWEKVLELCTKYGINEDRDLIQCELDSYREWLHQKSRCPRCGLTRFQTPDGAWHCPGCDY